MRRTVILLFTGNLFSKILGLIREVLTAGLFGTGESIAAFRIAQTGALTPANFFTSDSLNSTFVPLYIQFRGISADKSQTFLWSQIVLFMLMSVLTFLGLFYGGFSWVSILAPTSESGIGALATVMLQIMGLGIPFYLMSAILMFLAMANGDYVPMAGRPVVQNVGLIGGALAAFWHTSVVWLAWGFTIAYGVFFVWIVMRAYRAGWLALPSTWNSLLIRDVTGSFWRTLKPLLLLPLILQGNVVVERMIASLISLNAVAAIDYARFVTETLVLLISVPIGFAGLSQWSGLDELSLRGRLKRAIAMVFLIGVPISVFLIGNAEAIVRVMFMRGAFDLDSVHVTSEILVGMAVGLWAQVVGYVLIKAMNAQMRNRAVFCVMAVALLCNVLVNVLLYHSLGALTLGLGNAAYGVALLFGAVGVLNLWRELWHGIRVLLPCAVIYVLLASVLPEYANPWSELLFASVGTILFWSLCVIVIPELRERVYDLLQRNGRAVS